ncbi:long chain fatty alcohol oxidase [Biscogniauxia marginata]|nr:long chain fatty alcohol oxidase [Biscogniauxia marginata]
MADTTNERQEESPSHVDVPLPPRGDTSFFDEAQWRVWFALMDTVVPSIVSDSGPEDKRGAGSSSSKDAYRISPDALGSHFELAKTKVASAPTREDFEAYLAEKVSDGQAFRDQMARTLSVAPADTRKMLGRILSLLGSHWGSVPLTGYRRPFYELSANQREAVLRSWQASYLEALRLLAKTVTALAKKTFVQTSPQFARLSGWSDLPAGYRAGAPAGYGFRQFAFGDAATPVVLETDVVVVGSGCGGGVCAKVLAEAGHRVVVVDKGYYFPPAQLPMRSPAAEAHLFESNGAMGVDDGSLNIVAGSAWGGGGTVNWGVSLKTPDYVLREWAEKDGLPFFATPAFRGSLDRVADFMGVSDAAVRQNHRGQALLDGAARLGLRATATPHNSGGRDHHCGHCHFGCGSGAKQGPAVSWLPAAAHAGAEFVEGFHVDRVTFDDEGSGAAAAAGGWGSKTKKMKRATGIVGKWVSRDQDGGLGSSPGERVTRDIVIRAKRVVVSCGTLWSPVLLRKSGLKNPQIGKNLHLHPVNTVGAFWKEETRPWEGCAITSVCSSLENLDNQGHGVKLEPMCTVPLLAYANMPWRSAIDFKLCTLRYRHFDTFFSMARDRDTGQIYPDPETGRPRVAYTPSAFDRAHVLEGVIALARICHATGAEEIRPFLQGVEPFVRRRRRQKEDPRDDSPEAGEEDDPEFQDWLKHVRAAGNPGSAAWGSAHQMGSCRMSASAPAGVVDPRGAVWGVEGLYVADASVFPSASGVNPMITVMAIADWIARGVAAELKEEGVRSVL